MGRSPPFFIMLIAIALNACTNHYTMPTQVASNFLHRQTVTRTTDDSFPIKNNHTVSLYTNENSPLSAYKIIGVASVSKFNLFGKKREDNTLHEMIKELAASIGGDGLINIQNNDKELQGHVIAYQKILI